MFGSLVVMHTHLYYFPGPVWQTDERKTMWLSPVYCAFVEITRTDMCVIKSLLVGPSFIVFFFAFLAYDVTVSSLTWTSTRAFCLCRTCLGRTCLNIQEQTQQWSLYILIIQKLLKTTQRWCHHATGTLLRPFAGSFGLKLPLYNWLENITASSKHS